MRALRAGGAGSAAAARIAPRTAIASRTPLRPIMKPSAAPQLRRSARLPVARRSATNTHRSPGLCSSNEQGSLKDVPDYETSKSPPPDIASSALSLVGATAVSGSGRMLGMHTTTAKTHSERRPSRAGRRESGVFRPFDSHRTACASMHACMHAPPADRSHAAKHTAKTSSSPPCCGSALAAAPPRRSCRRR